MRLSDLRKQIFARPRAHLFLMVSLAVFLTFPDVFLTKASISNLERYQFTMQGQERSTFYSEKANNEPGHSFYDTDGAALQSEPAIQFMKHAIWNLESPYWNPFSGAGAVGPETMVDIKFSPHTLAIAALGGSNFTYHVVTMLFFAMALYFLARFLMDLLGLSKLGVFAVSFVFLLNGYFTANLTSNTNQAILYLPFLLFATLRLVRSPGVSTYLWTVVAWVLPLLVTFFPTTVLMATSSGILSLGLILRETPSWRARWRMLLVLGSAPVAAVLLLAFLYLPLWETLQLSGTVDAYGLRTFYPANFRALISFFSPKTFFESYQEMDPKFSGLMTNVIFHFGLVTGLVASLAIASRRFLRDSFFVSCLAIFILAMGRIFAVPGISHLVEALPFCRNIGEQYWWMAVACSFPILFAYGFVSFEKARYRVAVPWALAGLMVANLFYVGWTFGLPAEGVTNPLDRSRVVFYLIRVGLILFGSLYILSVVKKNPTRLLKLSPLLVFILFFDLAFCPNTLRYKREEVFSNPPDYIGFLRKNIGYGRTANFGSYGLPPELGSAFQIQQIEFFSMNLSADYFDLCQRGLTAERGWQAAGFCLNRDSKNEPNINEDILNLVGARYLLVTRWMPQFAKFFEDRKYPRAFETKNLTIYENVNAYPRAYGVSALYRSAQTPDVKGLEASSVAFTEDETLLTEALRTGVSTDLPSSDRRSQNFDRVKILKYHNVSVVVQTDFANPGVLVLSDNWHPNWQATLDGASAYVGRVNQSFRGIAVPPGRHTVEFKYQPKTLRLGLAVAACTMGLLCLLVIGARLRFRRKTGAIA